MPNRQPHRSRQLLLAAVWAFAAGSASSGAPEMPEDPDSSSVEMGEPYAYPYDQLYLEAADLIATEDWTKAFIDLNKAIALDPGRPEAYFVYGRAHFLRGEYPESEQAFNKVLEIDPGISAAWYELARLMVLKEDLPKAIDYTHNAIEQTDGKSWKYLTFLGELEAESGNRPAAEKAFDDAIRILQANCDTITKAIKAREQQQEVTDVIIDVDYYVVYQQMIAVEIPRQETRYKIAPSEWKEDLERMRENLAAVKVRRGEVLSWMESR